ncbi:MAG: HAD family phosphatase [Corynebacterium sp.]|uniref:HAD family hydrolase n=1 Tax=Corynebacterium sp. TaxID=1720 RepID=UPI0026DF4943|nr:HAD family phosphatase [Corynebacterium sp.]MDO5669077.1 HAD family phosphatase [Corynebacterium sp.]
MTPTSGHLLDGVRGILFDFNGTLSDDETELELAYGQALADLGLDPLTPDEYASLLGMSEPDIAAALIANRGADPALAAPLLDAVCQQYVRICARQPRVSPTTVNFVHWLHDHGWRVGIVTGTLRRLIEPVLSERGLSEHIEALVTVEDVSEGKPSPEGFLRGAEILGIDPKDILAFEDSPAGARAARAAGMSVIGIGPAADCELTYPTMEAAADALSAR